MDNKPKEETEDEQFEHTGVFSSSFDITIKVTEQDMLVDLVNKTEGKNIPANDLDKHNKN